MWEELEFASSVGVRGQVNVEEICALNETLLVTTEKTHGKRN